MDRGTGTWNRTRLRFTLLGAVCCLLAALGAEILFGRIHAAQNLRAYHTPSLLFVTEPATTTRTVAAPTPPPLNTDEMQRRLAEIGAQSGEVQVSLAWNNNNDLDLSCLDPNGELVDGYNQTSRSGGVLDVDMNPTDENLISPASIAKLNIRQQTFNRNRRSRMSDHPVENIVWANGRAPVGHYKVFVHQFCNKEQVESTPYWVEIRVRGQVQRINGATGRDDFADQGIDPKLVYEFDVTPPETVAAPTTPQPQPIPQAPAPPITVTHTAYSLARLDFALTTASLWGLLLGLLPAALFYGQRQYLRLPLWTGEQDFIVCVAGPVTGFLTAIVAQLLFSLTVVNLPLRALPLLLVLSWTVFGGLFGSCLGLFTPNLPRVQACIAGLISAFASCILFQVLAASGADAVGRVAAATVIGAAIGILIALPERERETKPEPEEEQPERPYYETRPPFVVRGTRAGKVGGLRRRD